MPRVYLSDELCDRARDKMEAIMTAGDGGKGEANQLRAATDLVKHCQTQERYNIKPQTPEDFERAANIRGSLAKQLDELTPEELLERQQAIVGDDFAEFRARKT